MAKIPIEDTFADVINKAQRGLGITDADLTQLAGVSAADLAAVKKGDPIIAVIRRVARHLRLAPNALERLAKNEYYPRIPAFPRGFALFNTDCGDMRVNNYVVWDPRSRVSAIFDSGADAEDLLAFVKASDLKVQYIFVTHAHEDHIAALGRLAKETGAQVWTPENEPVPVSDARIVKEGAYFHLGEVAIKTLLTHGHSPGMMTYYITGLSWPLAVVGDSVFAGSMGGSPTAFETQFRNNVEKIMTLPRDTVIAPGHGPLTTVGQEKRSNPFFAPRNERLDLNEIAAAKETETAEANDE